MTPSQRFALAASALSGIVLAGTVMTLVTVENRPTSPTVRPAPLSSQGSHPGVNRDAVRGSNRGSLSFTHVPSEVGILTAPPTGGESAWVAKEVVARPETWAVAVREAVRPEPVTAPPLRAQDRRLKRHSTKRRRRRPYALQKRLAQISPRAMPRLARKFEAAKTSWPPSRIALVSIKDEKVLDLYARAGKGGWTFIHRYPVLAASGGKGPKLRQGDRQVPEGVYRISALNPNSRYHVSLRINYPNAFDRRMAARDGRTRLGGDIMIHGKNVSAGCLAMGDDAAEELFVLVAEVGTSNARVVIAPMDFRRATASSDPGGPAWLGTLYKDVDVALSEFPAPPRTGLLSLLGL